VQKTAEKAATPSADAALAASREDETPLGDGNRAVKLTSGLDPLPERRHLSRGALGPLAGHRIDPAPAESGASGQQALVSAHTGEAESARAI